MGVIDPPPPLIQHKPHMEPAAHSFEATLGRGILEKIVGAVSDAVLVLDAQAEGMPVVYANATYEALTQHKAADLLGVPWSLAVRQSDDPGLEDLKAALRRREAAEIDVSDVRRDGAVWLSRVRVVPLGADADHAATPTHLLILQREAADPAFNATATNVEIGFLRQELGRARQRLDFLNRSDPVTGMPKYEQFAALLNRDLAIARRDRRPVSMIAFEIVELDIYRKTFGSKAADSCVRMVAAQISSTLRRAGDLFARYDDTTLVAGVPGQDTSEAALLAERIEANVLGLRLHNPRAISGRFVTVISTVCGGVPAPDDDADSLLEQAKQELERKRIDPRAPTYA